MKTPGTTTLPADVPSSVHFLNVGQAHATVAIGADSALIVDCPSNGVEQASALLKHSNPAQLDVMVTHQDLDHCGGVHELLTLFGKSHTTLYMNPVGRQSPQDRPRVKTVLQRILSVLDEIGANTVHAFAGRNGSTGISPGLPWHRSTVWLCKLHCSQTRSTV